MVGRLGAIITLLLGYVTFSMFRLSLGVAIPDILVEFSINELQAGVLYSAPFWSTAALLTPAGYLADRFGRRGVLLFGYLLLGLGVVGLASSSSYFIIIAFLVLAGCGAGVLVPSYYSLIGELLEGAKGFAIGLAAGVYNIGGLIGSILVGFLVSLHLWRVAYIIIAAAIFCLLVLQLIVIKRSSETNLRISLNFISILRRRNISSASLGVFLGSVAQFAAAAWLPTFFVKIIQFDVRGTGLLVGLFFFAGAFGSITLGALSDRFQRRTVCLLSGVSAASVTLLLLFTTYTFYLAFLYVFVFGFLIWPCFSIFVTIAQESVSKELVSSATGVTQTFALIGCAIGPVLAGALITYIGLPLALTFTTTLTTFAYGLTSLMIVEKRSTRVINS